MGTDANFPWTYNIYYPAESSARYLMTASGPVRKRYLLRHFVLGYGNGGYVIGWYHDRVMDMHIDDMTVNDLKILTVDQKINMNLAALYARRPDGSFITGPVWLCALSETGIGYCRAGPSSPQWDKTPKFVVHGRGWFVPSWVVPPSELVRHCIEMHEPHELPEVELTKKNTTRKRNTSADAGAGKNKVKSVKRVKRK